jgi:hypothetical protein
MTDIKTKLSTALWCDLQTDKEKAAWLLLGRGFETGVVSKSIQNDLAHAYGRIIELRQALAEQEQPVAFYVYEWNNRSDGIVLRSFRPDEHPLGRVPDRTIAFREPQQNNGMGRQ